ncbi:methyltransferase domain-containing protein [Halovivax gelatinilyticus]|uniref:methyltransferase domain-containing protein n=1 Tax=Halovivax gelatinilyticus TaxID=2961597 RepID=UPI0020CA990F|nr:methyltransferase domain-containing protein [Halovivax gelatinilyticus]
MIDLQGVISFTEDDHRGDVPDHDVDLASFTDALRSNSMRTAIDHVAIDASECETFLTDLLDVRRDVWHALVDGHISGRCLDLYAGYGRRSIALSARAESVHAVDPSLSKLTIASLREDAPRHSRIVPVHTELNRLPFAPASFDTIVVDLSGRSNVKETLRELSPYLRDGGSLLAIVDGWSKRTGIASLAGLVSDEVRLSSGVRPGTPSGYRSVASDLGFDACSVYALFPSASRPLYAYEVGCDRASRWLFESELPNRDRLASAIDPVLPLVRNSGILEGSLPSYLLACSKTPTRDAPSRFDAPVAVAGRARSVVLDVGVDGITDVWKLPNRPGHALLTERENSLLWRLHELDVDVTETLPDGEPVESPIGVARHERPVRGRPLDESLADHPDDFEQVLETGYEWLASFQRTVRGDSIERSPTSVRDELSFDPAGVDPPQIETPVVTFETPIHGDFIARNIHVENGSITGVIDWEYGIPDGCPVVDAGRLLIDAALQTVGDFDGAVRTVLCGDTEYAVRARAAVQEYCDAVDLPYRTFERCLPATYVHRLELDFQVDAPSTYGSRVAERARRAQRLADSVGEMTLSV